MQTGFARLAAMFVTVVTLAAGSADSRAQSSKQTIRVGVITFSERNLNTHLERALSDGFRDRGYAEGVNLIIERRLC